MIVEIRIEGKPVPGPIPGDHLYFVGVDENGNEFVIRGGPSDDVPPFEFIETEKGIPIEESEDYRPIEDRDARGSEVLDFGTQDVNEVWDKMKDAADKVERYKMNYDTLGTNSATAGAIVLSSVGIDIKDVLPDQPGQNDTYPGTGVLDSSELPDRVFDIMDEIIDEGIDFAQGLFNDLLELSQEVLIEIEEQIQEITSGAERTLNNLINEIEDFFRDAAALRLDPLTLDLDGDGLELTSLADSTTNFDLDNNGSAERTGWVSGDDGLLALDRNSNGTIDNGSELFGDATPINGGTEIAADGFEALSDLDSNADGVIDSNDAQFSDLRVWQDLDQDGVSDAGELSSLSDLGIDSIDLNATFNDGSVNGNDVTHLSTFTKNDQTQGTIGNVLFQSGHVNSEYAGEYTLSLDALLLPTIRGYGNAPDLHIAMSLDASLLTMVQNFAGAEAVQPEVDFFKNTEEMIYKWTGVEGVDPDLFGNVMGVPIDARKVKALEVFLATEYTGQLFTATLDLLNNAWDNLVNSIGTRLMVLGPAESLFPEASYSLAADSLTTTSTMAALTQVALDNQPTGQTENIGYWYNMKRVLYGFGLDKGLTTSDVDTEINLLASADEQEIIYMDDGKSVLFVPEGAGVITTDNAADLVLGFGSDDVINTTSGNDTIFGGDGNDVIDGGTGVNTIDGGAGDDTLSSSTVSSSGNSYTGGAGNDTIIGNSYSDNYYFNLGDGQDTITDLNGAGFYDDKIYLGAGITTADVSLSRESLDLLISVGAGGDQIRVKEWYANGTNRIEELHFDDGTVWDVNTLHQNGAVLFGTAGGDILTGLNGLTETIYGLDGNDVIDGGTGADTIDGGAGDDTLSSDFISSGGSTYTGGTGNDTITGGQYHDDYHFNLGDGQDTITDLAGSSLYSDKIYLGVGITTADVSLSRESLDLLISVGAGGDQIRVKEWYANNTNRIEELHFDDGTVWDVNTLHQNGAVLFGTAGDDILTGVDNLNGTIYGLGGNDTINTTSGNDTIFGGDGNDVIDGGTGANTIDGGAGDDTLSSSTVSSSGNSYTGGAGNDTITGNQYSDNYYFNLGDGQDTITDLNGAGFYDDKIYLGAGITTADVSLSRESLDLLISVGAGGDQIRVKEWYANGTNRIEELHFDDGTVWDVNTLHQNGAVLFGTAGDDILTGLNGLTETIYGLDGNDVIDGGTGADTIDGGAGDDTLSSDFISSGGSTYTGGTGNDTITGGQYNDSYHFNLGDGQDTITDLAGSSLYSDKIYLGAGITITDVSLSQENHDLLIDVGTGGDQIRIKDWYVNNANRVEELHFDDGTMWDVNFLHQNSAPIIGTASNDTLNGVAGENDMMYGLGGNDVIDGGTGANTLDGGAGDDTLSSDFNNSHGSTYTGGIGNDTITGGQYSDSYHFNLGDGQDTISEVGGQNSHLDKIYLGAGITIADVSVNRDTLDLVIDVGTGGDQIRIKDWYANNANRIEELHFDDGTMWDVNTLHQNNAPLIATEGDDILTGVSGANDIIYGLGGSDIINSSDGNDSVFGDDGNDLINGGTGVNTLDGGAGDDMLSSDFYGSDGSVYTGGTGNDTITGGYYHDSYHFNLGDGQDTISEVGGYSPYLDKIHLGVGVTTADVSLSRDNLDMLIDVGTGGDQIRIKDWYANNNNRIEELHFDDGTVWDVNTLHQNGAQLFGTEGDDTLSGMNGLTETIHGLGGNDVIDGGTGADTLDGGAGDDTLSSDFNNSNGSSYTGGTGNDTITGGLYTDSYYFNLGDGQDTISEVGGYNSIYYNDKIYLGAGIATTDVSLSRDNLDMLVDVGTGGDQIRIKDWYASNNNRIEELHFDDGTVWDVNTLHQNGAVLNGTEGDDTLSGINGLTETIQGLGGNDTISGGTGIKTIDGGAGDDTLSSDFTNSNGSTYTGGTGNDTITGGLYIDNYHFNLGDGQDTISEVGGYNSIYYNDKIYLGAGITTADVSLSRDNLDMLVDVGTGGDQIRIKDWYANNSNRVEELHFDDGTVWDVNTLHQNGAVLNGTEGDDTLSGVAGLTETINGLGGNDVIDGGTGADSIDGGAGDDTLSSDFTNSNGSTYTGGTGNDTITGGLYIDNYHFNLGDGQDTISEVGGYNSIYYNDKIYLGSGITTADVSLSRDNLDMLVDIGTGGDQIRIKDWYASNNNRIEELHFDDGTVWDVNTLHQSGAVLNGTEGADTLSGVDGLNETIHGLGGDDTINSLSGNDSVFGGDGNDVIAGGTGANTLDGGAGDDTLSSDFTNSNGSTYTGGTGNDTITGGLYIDNYHFNLGDGQDTISEVGGYNSIYYNDKIYLGSGIATTDVSVNRENQDILISVGTSGDQIRIKDWYASNNNRVEELHFDDGTIWDVNTLHNKGLELYGTSADDVITGYDNKINVIQGLDGNDTLTGGNSNDFIDGGIGTNIVEGGAGDDVLSSDFNASDGSSYRGGTGNDSVTGGNLEDTYNFNLGDGQDTVSDIGGAITSNDKLIFENMDKESLWFSQSGSDLVIDYVGTDDQVTVKDWYTNSDNHIEEIQTSDAVLHSNTVDQLVNAMAAFNVPTGVGAVIPPEEEAQLQPIIASSWQVS